MARSAMYQEFLGELQRHVPNLFGGRVLYVGANRISPPNFVEDLTSAGSEVHAIEIYGPNVDHYLYTDVDKFASILQGDVREIDVMGMGTFDAVLWWHGPEHLQADEWPTVMGKLEAMAPLVVLGCPWGVWDWDPGDGNPHVIHQTAVYPADLQALGYTTVTRGIRPDDTSNMIAWKGGTGSIPRESWHYAKRADSGQFWLVHGDTRQLIGGADKVFRLGLYPVLIVSEEDLDAIEIKGA